MMTRAAAIATTIVVACCKLGHATPLEPAWTNHESCRVPVTSWGADVAWLRDGAIVRVDRATGKLGTPVALPPLDTTVHAGLGFSDPPRLAFALGDVLMLDFGTFIAAIDGKNGKLLWRRDQPAVGIPTVQAYGTDVLYVIPSLPAVSILRLDGKTGATVWKADAAPKTGQIAWIDHDANQIYVASDFTLHGPDANKVTTQPSDTSVPTAAGFDAKTGRRLWSFELPRGTQFIVAGGSLLASVAGEGIRIFDGATGKERGRVGLSGVDADAQLVIARGDRAYVAAGHGGARDTLTAIDLGAKKIAWSVPLDHGGVIAISHDAVLAVDQNEVLRAFDIKTGGELAQFGVARTLLAYVAVDERSPQLIECSKDGMLALGDRDAPTAVEHATVTGHVRCKSCKKYKVALGSLAVQLGSATATTDRNGNFTIALIGRGSFELAITLPAASAAMQGDGLAWVPVDQTVVLSGRIHYKLGTIDLGMAQPDD